MSQERQYRIYLLGPDGHILKSEIISADHDDDALLKVLRKEHACELWEGQRFIGAVASDGSLILKRGYQAP